MEKNKSGFFDFCFRFGSAAAMSERMTALGFTADPVGMSHDQAAMDVIGTIFVPTGHARIVDGEPFEESIPVAGFHVNVRAWDAELAAQLEALPEVITPATPHRVWL